MTRRWIPLLCQLSINHCQLSIIFGACLLTGCAPLLEDLQNINANLRTVNSGFGTSTPSIHTVTATVDETVCNRAAFEEAFKRDYTDDWNSGIRRKESYYQLILKQSPQDAAARHNYALYHGKRVESLGYGNLDYGVNSADPCIVQSTLQGLSAGGRVALQDLKALEEQEIRR